MLPYPELITYIATYGYLAVFLGAIFEGEVFVTLAGLFSQQGYLSLSLVIILAYLGSVAGDSLWFVIGRYQFPAFVHKSQWFQRVSKKPVAIVNNRPELLAFAMRFMYGFRTLIPLGLGLSNIPAKKFFFYHSLGAISWVLVYVNLGYFFGGILEVFFGRIKHPQLIMIAVVVLVVVLFISIGRIIRKILAKKMTA